jgi:large subunit ribosomal protein L19
MNSLINAHTKKLRRKDIPEFSPGDHLRIETIIREGDKERKQPFEGDVIAIKNKGIATTFTIRKVSYGVGVERIFPINSPFLHSVKVLRRGKVRRAKLYYLRKLSGKSARIPEKRVD